MPGEDTNNVAPIEPPELPRFLDVDQLLETSQPRARTNLFMPAMVILIGLVLGSTYLSTRSPSMKALVDVFSAAVMLSIAVGMFVLMMITVRKHREERMRIEAIEELIQLRRWQYAAAMLQATLLRPTLSVASRAQLLLFLATVLARYNRFDDAISVHDHLLKTMQLDPAMSHAVQLARAMAMLREDHLVDADRAINELRRNVSRIISPRDLSEPVEAPISAGLSLIEIYRDVKTGHATEAIEMFNRTLPAMQKQLGSRVADAHALAAKAYDFLSDTDRAQSQWEKATVLSPALELQRRYPELTTMAAKYRAVDAPPEFQHAEAA